MVVAGIPKVIFFILVLVGGSLLFLDQQHQALSEWSQKHLRLGCHEKPARRPTRKYPPLSTLINASKTTAPNEITGNVQFLLDFAIIGHPKCATSATLRWLAKHDEIEMYSEELSSLRQGQPVEFVRAMYKLPRYGLHGYKCPNDVRSPRALGYFARLWPQTKLIVGIRHPVLWYESFYNFKVNQGYKMPAPDSKELVGACAPESVSHGLCTDGSLFHHHLALMGKTNMTTDSDERTLLKGMLDNSQEEAQGGGKTIIPNKVFLYEISQISDEDTTRAYTYRHDLSSFIGLNKTLEPKEHSAQYALKPKSFNICETKYNNLRSHLMKTARAASLWIRRYFIVHPDVMVSSPEYFEELLVKWMADPCLERMQQQQE